MTAHEATVKRAALPEILFVPDVALALQVTPPAARRAIKRGECGPYLRIGRRLAVRRTSFLHVLADREIDPESERGLHIVEDYR